MQQILTHIGEPPRPPPIAPDVRQPHTWTLTPHPTPNNLMSQANLYRQGGLDFLGAAGKAANLGG